MTHVSPEFSINRRRYLREPNEETASVVLGVWPFRRTLPCTLRNLSDTGASIELHEDHLDDGEKVTLHYLSKTQSPEGIDWEIFPVTGTVIRHGLPSIYALRFSPNLPEQIQNHRARPRKIIAGLRRFLAHRAAI